MMKDKYVVAMVGIICVTAIEVASILTGIDGVMAISIVGSICAIVGYSFGHFKKDGEK